MPGGLGLGRSRSVGLGRSCCPGRAVVVKLFLSRIVFLLDGFLGIVTLEITKRKRSTAIGAETTEREVWWR